MRPIQALLGFVAVFAVLSASVSDLVRVHAQAAAPATAAEVIVQQEVPMKTRDGVTLYADIYRPNSADKFPVILMRTPYDKSVGWAVSPAAHMVRRGYVVIIQ